MADELNPVDEDENAYEKQEAEDMEKQGESLKILVDHFQK